MDLGANIFNAFEVVNKTHESIQRLMRFCENKAVERGDYVLVSPKFLRWNTDSDPGAWSYKRLIQLYQREADDEFGDYLWRDGPLFVFEMSLYDPDNYDIPVVNISKYEYEDIASKITWPPSPTNYWSIKPPMYSEDKVKYEYSEDRCKYEGTVIDTRQADRHWWGLRRIVGFSVPLIDITNENAEDIIFGGFDSLVEK